MSESNSFAFNTEFVEEVADTIHHLDSHDSAAKRSKTNLAGVAQKHELKAQDEHLTWEARDLQSEEMFSKVVVAAYEDYFSPPPSPDQNLSAVTDFELRLTTSARKRSRTTRKSKTQTYAKPREEMRQKLHEVGILLEEKYGVPVPKFGHMCNTNKLATLLLDLFRTKLVPFNEQIKLLLCSSIAQNEASV